MTNLHIDLELSKVRKHFQSDLEIAVIETFENNTEWKTYLNDASKHGCVSGMVSELIYYNQTSDFHDEHENEIDELIEYTIDSIGLSFSELASNIDVWDIPQLKNWKAWFAYEEVVNRIIEYIDELEN